MDNLTIEQKANQAYAELVRTSYTAYCYHTHDRSRWVPTRLGKYLCEEVQSFLETETDNPYEILILSVPPQHGKSMTITETLPSWYLCKNPMSRVIMVSYNEDTAKIFGQKNVEKLRQYGKEFGVKLRNFSSAEFMLTNGVGGAISRGFFSGITGKSANLMIIDDPVKNREEADSKTMRAKLIDEWASTLKSRLSAKARVIVIQTRWRHNDFAGYLIETEPFVRVINIPCEAEANDPLGREIGEPLVPEAPVCKDKEWLEAFKSTYQNENGIAVWNSLYQGHPSVESGNIFKNEWFPRYKEPPNMVVGCISVDASFKDKETSDYVAIQAWIKNGQNYYLLKRFKRQMGFVDTLNEIKAFKAQYPDLPIVIEDKANGSAIIEVLRLELPDVIDITPQESKIARAQAVTPLFENGHVFYPYSLGNDYIEEMTQFPFASHDDEVDSTTQALNWLKGRYADEAKPEPKFNNTFGINQKPKVEKYFPA